MCTGFVLGNRMSIHIYLYALQNVFPMEAVLQMPWVHELLKLMSNRMMMIT